MIVSLFRGFAVRPLAIATFLTLGTAILGTTMGFAQDTAQPAPAPAIALETVLATINGAPIRVKAVKDFDARFQGNKIVFEFTVPLQTTERKDANVIEARVFDPEYYVEFAMRQTDPIVIEHGDDFSTSCNVVRNEPKVSVLGPVNTDRATCAYALKP